ncbi:Receptor-like cytosolic serine/threonine-protein kinase RBK2 [Linum perenne]
MFCSLSSSCENLLSFVFCLEDKLIGEGGYAEVYKGQLSDGQFVAIKRLVRGSSPEEMTMDFLSELGIICHVDHPNIAKLIGYGVEGGMHLVLQLSINGSVSSLLYGPREKLSWPVRYKIAYGTAVGLLYLHEGCQRRIIHKDIKAANILLTEDFDPQIADFGLARWLPENWTHHTVSKIEGTFGYLPPEFFMHGIVDEKTDVYAYGVLLLELITGRQALDSSQQSLVMWAKPLLIKNKISDLVDPVLGQSYNLEQMERLVCLAAMCVEQASVQRPQMSQMGDESTLEEVKRRQKSKLQRTYSEELFDADEYNSTRYLCDLNIHLDDLLEPDDDLENFEECHSATKLPPPGEEETAAKNNGDAEKSKKDEDGLKNDGESKKDDEEGKSKDEGKPKEAEEKKRSKDEGKQKEAEEKKRSKDEGKPKEAEEKKRLKDEGKQKEAEEKKRLKDEVKQKEAEEKKRLKDEVKQKEAEEKKRLKDEGKQKEAEEKKRLKDEVKQQEAEEKKRLKDEGKQKEAEEKK